MAKKGKQDGRTTLRELFDATRATAAGELTDAEFRFWMMVRSLEGADRGCYADTEYLMTLLRRSESHVKQVRASLARKGWLKVIRRGPKAPELRAVLSPEEVHEGEHQAKEAHEEVHSHELSPTPPIEESTGSTEKTPEEEILENRTRYSPEQLAVVDSRSPRFAQLVRRTGSPTASSSKSSSGGQTMRSRRSSPVFASTSRRGMPLRVRTRTTPAGSSETATRQKALARYRRRRPNSPS